MKVLLKLLFVFAIICISQMAYMQDTTESGASLDLDIKKEVEVKAEAATTEKTTNKTENVWKTLSRITYRKEYDELMGFKIDKPVFSKQVHALEGTEITIKGYVIPVEGYKSHTEFIFSAFPYNMCFFCGGAGPETVMEVLASEPVKYSAEQVTLKGKIQLNADDINRLMYQLVDATLVD